MTASTSRVSNHPHSAPVATENAPTPPPAVRTENLSVAYGRTEPLIVNSVDALFPAGKFSAVIGPNGCGKSTLVRALARLESPRAGAVYIGDEKTADISRRDLAKRMAVMAQHATAPEGITVRELVSRGRFAHQGMMGWRSKQDVAETDAAMRTAGVEELATKEVAALSGGQRQRVWFAMALAQNTPVVVLDEPTSALDIGYQHSFMQLMRTLTGEKTLIAVIHDLAHVLRYADHVVALHGGEVQAAGAPSDVITPKVIRTLYGLDTRVEKVAGEWAIVPRSE